MNTTLDDFPHDILQYAGSIKLIESLNIGLINRLTGATIPFRSDGITIFIVRRGRLLIEIDYSCYLLEANDLLIKMPEHAVMKIEAQDYFEGIAVMVKREFLEGTVALINRALYGSNYMQIRLHPCCRLSNNDAKRLTDAILLVKEKILCTCNSFQREIVQCAILMMLLECESMMLMNQYLPTKLSRQEQTMHHFLELLKDNCKREHKVEFYAGKLCITPQYLSLTLKAVSGITAYRWIAYGITTEAKILLKDVGLNVQQIAEALYFPDPSSFGKFFKKQTGLSPFKYRNMNSENQNPF